MSVTTAPPAFTDPLAEDVATPSFFPQSSEPAVPADRARQTPIARDEAPQDCITRDRAALLAPDVKGQLGADAIDLVRAKGLIAAIETVEIDRDGQQGLVVDQNPPPGTQMAREGVLTLSVAQAPVEARGTQDDNAHGDQPASAASAYEQDEDDTEQWFATLSPTLDGPTLGEPDAPNPPRRRRKHRPAPIPVTEATASADAHAAAPFEVPPDPLPAAYDSPTEEHPSRSPQPAGPGRFTSLLIALLVRLPDRSVMPTWRRRALIFAAGFFVLVILTRAGISHSHQAIPASLAQAPASPLRPGAATTPARHPRSTHTTPHDRPAPRLPAVPPRRAKARRTSRELTTANASDAHRVPSTPAPASPPSEPAPGPFVYLGK